MSDEGINNNSVKIDKEKIKHYFHKAKKIAMDKRFQIAITAILLLVILISAYSIRVSNLNNLKDITTGEYTAGDPDALYFMRLTEVVLEKGNLDGIDEMRTPGAGIVYLEELMPYWIVAMYKVANVFSPGISWKFIAVISPAIFFVIGMIAFFLLCYYLTKSKSVALLASAFLAFSPAYLFRTMSGVLDHDSMGMIGFFSALLIFAVGLNHFEKSWKKTLIFGIALGMITALAMGMWAGGVTFLFMIIPASILVYYLFNLEDAKQKREKLIVFNFLWIGSFLLSMLLIGFPLGQVINKLISPSSLLTLVVPLFIFVDYLLSKNIEKIKLKFIKKEKRILYSIALTLVLGILFMLIIGMDIIGVIKEIYIRLLNPLGGIGRLGSTVSENAQPYLENWTGQMGKSVFWMFFAGFAFVSLAFAKNIKRKRHKIIFILLSLLAVSGILFSRVGSISFLNGENFISSLFYVGSLSAFAIYTAYLYFKHKFEIGSKEIILFFSIFFMILMGRAAARTIFVATPFVCLTASYLIFGLFKFTKKAKDNLLKILLKVAVVCLILLTVITLLGNPIIGAEGQYQAVKNQAASMGPVSNYQWQYAMSWARENTDENSVFVHWWDYGYQVQTLGERKTLSDGGHSAGDSGDHNVGRYILTTPNPETALSYMKTWNISYLLIDPTDFGKYAPYSKIGSNQDYDRFASPSLMVLDPSQTKETANARLVVYTGNRNSFVDEDIIYGDVFIPGPSFTEDGTISVKSGVLGALIETEMKSSLESNVKQPQGIYYYNGQQYLIPIRYVYYNNEIMDFKTGIDATLMLLPKVSQNSQGQIQVDQIGAATYLSPKVSAGLFAKLYLMNDPFNEYPTIKEANSQQDAIATILKQQGIDIGEFFYYDGLRGPLKIWEVNYPAGTETHEEFLQLTSNWEGELDKLFK